MLERQELEISELLELIASRFDIELVDSSVVRPLFSGWSMGPLSGALHLTKRKVSSRHCVTGRIYQVEDVLHEMMHVVMGQGSMEEPEEYGLMQYEWAVAEWAAKLLAPEARRGFLIAVRKYQDNTSLGSSGGSSRYLGDCGYNVRTYKWWRDRKRLLIEHGMLTTHGTPTWKYLSGQESKRFYQQEAEIKSRARPRR